MFSDRVLHGRALAAAFALGLSATPTIAQQEACIGNSAAITGPAAFGGQAIKMGAEIAIDEINAKGGVLGKPLRFVQYDDAGAPPRGVDNTRRIALTDKCVAILGGYHSTVAVAQAEPVNAMGIPYVGVLAANTKAVENGANPNFMFRVSAKDKWVASFLVEQALKKSKTGKIAFLYENTGWGNGALPDVKAAMAKAGKELASAETFNWGDQDMTPQVIRARDAGADVVLLWALDREGNQILRSMDKVGYKASIIGAWGIAGNLGELAGPLADGVEVVQTYTFMGEMDAKKKAIWDKLQAKYSLKQPSDIKMPSGVANAYDAVYIIAAALEKAGSFDSKKLREALYTVNTVGLVADYKPAFDASDPERQDAVLPKYYKLTVWLDGKLLPVEQTKYGKPN
jgi:branched-chain amino acid transport system substrate-binding protein